VTRAQRDARTTAERDAEIRRVRREFNWTYEHIGSLYGITRQRAWQIVTKAGKA
jgi:DNA-directed RNA polymerase sigma subunit (sigma70/sigma32)